ncbi:major facilitator superfamily domain-containing protein [Lineolata rhizophorae]|uniref:Major facilitator superfamily domain-containing protein n=1 Tax=Lineolata rhizophorae TaxID=578093 RepID=A0A6A6P810_9PEZI|nr:major facilitator superfamily domain-containing protein [Lineolata rhizophorae]
MGSSKPPSGSAKAVGPQSGSRSLPGAGAVEEVEDSAAFPRTPTADSTADEDELQQRSALERRIRLKTDLRLCPIAGLLCSLNLLDSGIISSAAVTSMPTDLSLDQGSRFSLAIFIFTLSGIAFQLPATVLVRSPAVGPRAAFAAMTLAFGAVTLGAGFVRDWAHMVAARVLLGAAMAGVYPGLTVLVSAWYTRAEQQLRFALLQAAEVVVLATGGIVNWALYTRLDGAAGLAGWRWMFVVQGSITMFIGVLTYFWMIDFPERAARSLWFLSEEEAAVAAARIQRDRGDVKPDDFKWSRAGMAGWGEVLVHGLDPKVWGFAVLYFLLNLVSTSLSYFLPIILQGGMGFSSDRAILLSAPPYYWAVLPAIVSSWVGDRFRLRGPIIVFNALCLILGFGMLGFSSQVSVRYVGTYLATGAYVANWAALNAYQANNITGQWKRVFTAAAVTAFNGAGGIAGSFIVRQPEAPRYFTAVWISIGSHILMIAFVSMFSVYFFMANRRQRLGKRLIENTVGFRYTY